jgi:hypothetical protein
MHTVPDWLQTAFAEWVTGRLYIDAAGNYRKRVADQHRDVVSYNRALKHAYGDNREFHRAAERWLQLWELVPTARLNDSKLEGRP